MWWIEVTVSLDSCFTRWSFYQPFLEPYHQTPECFQIWNCLFPWWDPALDPPLMLTFKIFHHATTFFRKIALSSCPFSSHTPGSLNRALFVPLDTEHPQTTWHFLMLNWFMEKSYFKWNIKLFWHFVVPFTSLSWNTSSLIF